MERKTKIDAEDGKHDLRITREFDLPLDLLFRAFSEPALIEQWMGTKILKLDAKKNGSYALETSDANGNIVFKASGVYHEYIPKQKIIRTFEMANAPFGVQLEITEFEELTDKTSKVTMHQIYESVAQRDELLKLPFAYGINMAHNRIEELLKTLNN